MRRHLIGAVAVLCLLGAVWFKIRPPENEFQAQLESACCRAGALAAVVWLAYTEIRRMPGWFWLALPVLAVILVKWPRYMLYAVPIVVVMAIFKPPPKRRRPTGR